MLNEAGVVECMHSPAHFLFIHQKVHLRIAAAAAVLELLIVSNAWRKRLCQSHSLKAMSIKDPLLHCDL